MSINAYSAEEDDLVVAMINDHASYRGIGKKIGRNEKSVAARVWRLRQEGRLRRTSKTRQIGPGIVGEPALALMDDDLLVRTTLAEGGFPRAVATPIGTVWADHRGLLWQHAAKDTQRRAT